MLDYTYYTIMLDYTSFGAGTKSILKGIIA
jgi:hypothetical protein